MPRMTAAPADHRARPVVAILTAHWGTAGEDGWITRQVAGALAYYGDVHIVTPEGTEAGSSTDGVFTLHRLASPPAREHELRRDLLVQAFRATGTSDDVAGSEAVRRLLDRGLVDSWDGATDVLDRLRPDRTLIVGHRNVGALEALDRHRPSAPYALLALADDDGIACPRFDPLIARAASVLAVTEPERESIVAHHGRADAVWQVGAPLSANPSARSEPNTWIGDSHYILVLTGVGREDESTENELCRLIRMRFPERPVGISHTDAFCVWHQGRLTNGWPIERSSDLARLLAFAAVTVDFRPGDLFARRALESLLYGSPIIVPAGSRAAEHARHGRAGLWFGDPAELVGCIEALLEPSAHSVVVAQGRAYAESEYGSTRQFISRVTASCGLSDPAASIAATA